MTLQPRRIPQQLRLQIQNADLRTAHAYEALPSALLARYIDPAHAASEVASSISINGFDETVEMLREAPHRFGHINDARDFEVETVLPALEAYYSALQAYWQSCDELDLVEHDRSKQNDLQR